VAIPHIATVAPPSATLAANERVQAKLAAGEDVLHLAFGEAGLPVLPAVADRLAEGAGRNAYGSVRLADGVAGEEAGAALGGLASEIWSALAAPMQHVAAYVLSEPPEIVEHVAASRRLHRAVTTAAYDVVIEAGARCRAPGGAFYLYPEFGAFAEASGAALAERLLEERGIAVLPGEAFGDDPAALRFRMAMSLLYGDTDERKLEALQSDDPVALPWIASALERLAQGLGSHAASTT
jgi:aspartate/methionine/tyrosine aminotransferase